MSDFAIVWLEHQQGSCVLCGEETGIGAVGWHQGNPPGPLCDTCLLDRERVLGELLMKTRLIDAGPVN